MGVKKCDRTGCENVMCDSLSHNFGYICSECFSELSQIGNELSGKEIRRFMLSRKNDSLKINIFDEFKLQ